MYDSLEGNKRRIKTEAIRRSKSIRSRVVE